MSQLERLYRIRTRLLRRPASIAQLTDEFEVSRATVKRDIEFMRDRLGLPIRHDRDAGGYVIDASQSAAPAGEIPGLWFTDQEALALLTMSQLLEGLDGSQMLRRQLRPLRSRIERLLSGGQRDALEIRRRVKVLPKHARRSNAQAFAPIAQAVLSRQRLRLIYHVKRRDETTEREVSPQRLVHYRDVWYLDAWCHLRGELRSFALDGVVRMEPAEGDCVEVDDQALDNVLGAGYGIFSGAPLQWARLRFTGPMARYVEIEQWHHEQRVLRASDGSLLLDVPYTGSAELVRDVLAFGSDVEVLWPHALRQQIAQTLVQARGLYEQPATDRDAA